MSSPDRIADVLVLGEALIDIVVRGGGSGEHVGGSPANVALGLGRLGLDVALLTALGRDERGAVIAAHLEESGVRLPDGSFSAARTSTATARIAEDGSAEYEFDLDWALPADVAVGRPRLLHTGSIAAFLAPGATAVRDYLRAARGAEITFDPNIRPALVGEHGAAVATFEETAGLATLVKLSDEDAEWLYPGTSIDEVLAGVLRLGPRLAVVTRGAAGSVLGTPEHRVEVPTVRVQVADTIGAGDTYMASLIASVLDGGSADLSRDATERIGLRAARAAAVTVSRAGADLPWRRELDADPE